MQEKIKEGRKEGKKSYEHSHGKELEIELNPVYYNSVNANR